MKAAYLQYALAEAAADTFAPVFACVVVDTVPRAQTKVFFVAAHSWQDVGLFWAETDVVVETFPGRDVHEPERVNYWRVVGQAASEVSGRDIPASDLALGFFLPVEQRVWPAETRECSDAVHWKLGFDFSSLYASRRTKRKSCVALECLFWSFA